MSSQVGIFIFIVCSSNVGSSPNMRSAVDKKIHSACLDKLQAVLGLDEEYNIALVITIKPDANVYMMVSFEL